eukprot:g2992.t1
MTTNSDKVESPTFTERYSRQMLLPQFGPSAQRRLMNASVLIVGAGGLGCPVGMYLAGAGIGRIGLVDDDSVCRSNLHRQVAHTDEGAKNKILKVDSLRSSILSLNPNITCDVYKESFTPENAIELVSDFDVVVDCSDNLSTRYFINDACVLTGRALISGAAVAFDGQVSVYNFEGGPCYRCVNPQPPEAGATGSCSSNGVLGAVPGVIGTLMAVEVIKVIGKFGEPLRQKLCLYDAFSSRFRTIRLPERRPDCHVCSKRIKSMADSVNWADNHGVGAITRCPDRQIKRIRAQVEAKANLSDENCCSCFVVERERKKENSNILLIDVRSPTEHAICTLPGAINIPLANLKQRINEIKKLAVGKARVYVYCRRGISSQTATRLLLDNNITTACNMNGGLISWKEEIDPNFPNY